MIKWFLIYKRLFEENHKNRIDNQYYFTVGDMNYLQYSPKKASIDK